MTTTEKEKLKTIITNTLGALFGRYEMEMQSTYDAFKASVERLVREAHAKIEELEFKEAVEVGTEKPSQEVTP